ncbi:MAG: cation:proton antiporter [Phycisphaerales bacterium]|jgi:CPA2 family monovalent cation:H+ antiporter-2|nr:cation:proton antiporter [Phycisphaerales bacterium]
MLTLASGSTSPLARDLLIVLLAASIVAMMLHRLRVAVAPGYLIAGAIIGPYAAGLVSDPDSVESISSIATILLMFLIGLHLDLSSLRGGMVRTLLIGVVSSVVTTAIFVPLGMLFHLDLASSLTVAMGLSMSSTALVLKLLQARREMNQLRGRIAFGVLIVQDVLAIVALAVIPVLAAWRGSSSARMLAQEPGQAAMEPTINVLAQAALVLGVLALMIVLGRVLLPRLLREAARESSGELLLVLSAAIALGAAGAMTAVGVSAELGAFLAGFLLAGTPFRYQLSGKLAPLRDLFMAAFFTAVGMKLDVGASLQLWWVVGLASVLLIVVKTLGISVSAWALGIPAAPAVSSGLVLAQAGEFSLVVLAAGATAGLVSDVAMTVLVAASINSLVFTPLLAEAGRWADRALCNAPMPPWIRSATPLAHPSPSTTPSDAPELEQPPSFDVVIAGYGPVGRAAADALEREGARITVIELNARTVQKQATLGRRIVFGDAANDSVLESAGIEHADALVLAVPDEQSVIRACQAARALAPDLFIAVRTNSLSMGMRALQVGADHAVVEEMATAVAMAREVTQKVRERREGKDTGPKLYRMRED